MLKSSYDSQDAIPENQRGAYVQKGDKWVLDDLDATHPVLVHNRTLKKEKDTAEGEAATAKTELANANVLQRGQVAVAKADADLLEKVKAAGTPEQVTEMLEKYPTLSEQVTKQARKERLDGIRKAFEWNENAVSVLDLIQDLPDTEDREVERGGKKVKLPHAKVKEGDAFTFKPFDEYFAERHPALMPSVQATQQAGTKVFGSTPGSSTTPQTNPVDTYLNTTYSPPKKAAA